MEEILSLFESSIHQVVLGKKLNWIGLHSKIYSITNSTTNLSILSEMKTRMMEIVARVIVRLEEGEEKFVEKIDFIDSLSTKLFKGRTWALSNEPELLILGSSTFLFISHEMKMEEKMKRSLIEKIEKKKNDMAKFLPKFELKGEKKEEVPLPRWYFTRTKNVLNDFDITLFPTEGERKAMVKTYLPLPRLGFTLDNILSGGECKYLIEEAKKVGFASILDEFLPNERDNKRVLLMCPKLEKILWERMSGISEDFFFFLTDFRTVYFEGRRIKGSTANRV